MYALLADLTVLLHFLFIVFVVLGGLLVIRFKFFYLIHLPCAVYGAAIEFFGWICPLTYLENALRRGAAQPGYEDSFIQQYLMPVIYPAQLDANIQLLLGIVVILVNIAIYGAIWARSRKR